MEYSRLRKRQAGSVFFSDFLLDSSYRRFLLHFSDDQWETVTKYVLILGLGVIEGVSLCGKENTFEGLIELLETRGLLVKGSAGQQAAINEKALRTCLCPENERSEIKNRTISEWLMYLTFRRFLLHFKEAEWPRVMNWLFSLGLQVLYALKLSVYKLSIPLLKNAVKRFGANLSLIESVNGQRKTVFTLRPGAANYSRKYPMILNCQKAFPRTWFSANWIAKSQRLGANNKNGIYPSWWGQDEPSMSSNRLQNNGTSDYSSKIISRQALWICNASIVTELQNKFESFVAKGQKSSVSEKPGQKAVAFPADKSQRKKGAVNFVQKNKKIKKARFKPKPARNNDAFTAITLIKGNSKKVLSGKMSSPARKVETQDARARAGRDVDASGTGEEAEVAALLTGRASEKNASQPAVASTVELRPRSGSVKLEAGKEVKRKRSYRSDSFESEETSEVQPCYMKEAPRKSRQLRLKNGKRIPGTVQREKRVPGGAQRLTNVKPASGTNSAEIIGSEASCTLSPDEENIENACVSSFSASSEPGTRSVTQESHQGYRRKRLGAEKNKAGGSNCELDVKNAESLWVASLRSAAPRETQLHTRPATPVKGLTGRNGDRTKHTLLDKLQQQLQGGISNSGVSTKARSLTSARRMENLRSSSLFGGRTSTTAERTLRFSIFNSTVYSKTNRGRTPACWKQKVNKSEDIMLKPLHITLYA